MSVRAFPLVYLDAKTVTLDLEHFLEDFRQRLKLAAGQTQPWQSS
jgi:hypothetical protein